MANNKIQVKRTSTSGRAPNTTNSGNTQFIDVGELALNLADGILYSSNGSSLITVGANQVNQSVTGTLTANTISLNNDQQLRFKTVNSSSYAYFVQQSDDNFVFYTTNTAYGARPIWSIYSNSATSFLSIGAPVSINGANLVLSTTVIANGSAGSSGQVLKTNGSGVYWATVTGGGSVDTDAQYTWTNTQTFSANISFTGNNISVVNGTGSIQFNGAGDVNWRIGRATGTLTKTYYTNNTLDIIAGGSNLEGVVFGNASNTYLELGANGVYTKNQIYVGSTTTNLAINSTSISSSGATQLSITANNMTLGSANGIALYSTAGQVNAASGNLVGYAYAALGGAGGNYLAFGQQTNNFAQWIQSGYAASPSSVYYNIILNPLGGSVGVGNTVPTAKFSVNGTTYLQGNVTFTQGIVDSTGSQGTAGQVLASNGAGNVYWVNAVNVAAQFTWTNTQTFSNTITFSSTINGTANNASYLGGTIASGYQTTAGLSANVATLTANAATYLNGKTESNLNVNNALTANNSSYLGGVIATGYQTTAGLSANVATLTANNTTYVNGKTESNLNVNNALTANNSSYLGGVAAASYIQNTDSRTLSGNLVYSGTYHNPGSNTVLLGNSTSRWVVSANTIDATGNFTSTANVTANNANTTYDLNVGRNLTVTGNLTVSGNVTIIGANNLSVVDNMIYLNSNSTTANPDIGIAANYNDGTYRHTGIFRDASDGIWKVFDSYTPEPDANVYIDTTNTSFQIANFQANTLYLGNTSTNWLVANGSGAYHTGTINAASHTVGTNFVANATNIYVAGNSQFGANATTGGVGIGRIPPATAGLAVNSYYTDDTTTYSVYMQTAIANASYTAARTSFSLDNFTVNLSEQKDSGNTVQYNAALIGNRSLVYNGNATSGGDAFAATLEGFRADVRNYANGAASNTVTTTRGGYFLARPFSSGIMTTVYGVHSTVQPGNTTVTGNTTTAAAFRADVGLNNSLSVTGTGFLFDGRYGATVNVATKYGVYISGESNNYFSSNVWVGGTLSSGANVYINATAAFISTNSTVNTIITATSFTQANTTATPFVANTSGLYHTGVVNAATIQASATFTANSTLVNAAAINVTGQVNAATLYASTSANVGTAFVANTLGAYHTGTVNAASFTVGTGLVINSTSYFVGNSTVNTSILLNAINLNASTNTAFAISKTQSNTTLSNRLDIGPAGGNSAIAAGPFWSGVHISSPSVTNSTAGALYPRASHFYSYTNTTAPTDMYYNIQAGNDGGLGTGLKLYSINTSSVPGGIDVAANGNVGIGNTVPTDKLSINGTASISGNLNILSTGDIVLSNSASIYANGSIGTAGQLLTSNGTTLYYANSTTFTVYYANGSVATQATGLAPAPTGANTQIFFNDSGQYNASANLTFNNSTSTLSVNTFTANSSLVNTAAINVVGQVNTATLYAATSANLAGTTTLANTLGVFTTGTINAASYTIGSTLIANTLGVYHTGTMNAASFSVGTAFTANSTLVNAAAVSIIAGNTTSAPLRLTTGTLTTSASNGTIEFVNPTFYATPTNSARAAIATPYLWVQGLSVARTAQIAAQGIFGAAGTSTLAINLGVGRYRYALRARYTASAVATNFQYALGGTAVLGLHSYNAVTKISITSSLTAGTTTAYSNAKTATFTGLDVISAASTAAASFFDVIIDGIIDVTTAGTVIFQQGQSAATAVLTLQQGSFIEIFPYGAGAALGAANTNIGGWA